MDLVSILTAIGASGVVTAVVSWVQNRRINNATAYAATHNAEADYTCRIIEQADKRVAQALDDRDRAFRERAEAYETAKRQCKDKHRIAIFKSGYSASIVADYRAVYPRKHHILYNLQVQNTNICLY